jgi:hypothetical protein
MQAYDLEGRWFNATSLGATDAVLAHQFGDKELL